MPGTTPQETRILELWDAGCSIEQITRRTGFGHRSVQNVVSTYNDAGETRASCNAMIAASTMLAAAIAQAKMNRPAA